MRRNARILKEKGKAGKRRQCSAQRQLVPIRKGAHSLAAA